jgi:hypothetical protein
VVCYICHWCIRPDTNIHKPQIMLYEFWVNVFGFDEGEMFPLYLSKLPNEYREVDLLYISNETNQHYCWIKNLNRFLKSINKHNSHYYCRRCLHGFIRKELLDAHRSYCDRSTINERWFAIFVIGAYDLIRISTSLKLCYMSSGGSYICHL